MKKFCLILILVFCLTATANQSGFKPILGRQISWGNSLSIGVVGCWPMYEGGGNIVMDLSGNNNTGTFVNDAHFIVGKFGSAVDFDGAGDHITCGSGPSLDGMAGLTISVVFKTVSQADINEDTLVSNYSANGPYLLRYDSNNNQIDFFVGDGGSQTVATNDVSVEDGLWHHVIGVYDGVNVIVYLDGVKLANEGSFSGVVGVIGTDTEIGRSPHNASDYFTGIIDNAMMWNRGLSSFETTQLYINPFAMLEQVPIWMYKTTAPPAVGGQVIIVNMN
jgi:hypothetical protein